MEETFGRRISKLRLEKKISQAELSKRLGMSQNTIAMWEVGKREPDIETIAKLADFFEVSTDYLLKGEEFNLVDQINYYENRIKELEKFIDEFIGKGNKILNRFESTEST